MSVSKQGYLQPRAIKRPGQTTVKLSIVWARPYWKPNSRQWPFDSNQSLHTHLYLSFPAPSFPFVWIFLIPCEKKNKMFHKQDRKQVFIN